MYHYTGKEPEKFNDFDFFVNGKKIQCSKTVVYEMCDVLKKKECTSEDINSYSISLDKKIYFIDITLVQKLFTAKLVKVNETDIEFLNELSNVMEINSLKVFIHNIILKKLEKLENIIYSDMNSIEQIISSLYELKFLNYKTICHSIMNCCFSRSSRIDQIIECFLQFDKLLKIREQPEILATFHEVVISYMKLIDQDFLFGNELFYIVRRLTDKGIIKLSELVIFELPPLFNDLFDLIEDDTDTEIVGLNNIDLMIKLHKAKVVQGKNLDEIALTIRNDDIDSFIFYIKENSNYINGTINKNDFERVTLVNTGDCSYIEYAAFFGSEKVFNFIYDEIRYNKMPELLPFFSVAGGSLEIIKKCEAMDFKEAISVAIEFHRTDIFKFLYESNDCSDSADLLSSSIEFSNFSLFLFLISSPTYDLRNNIVAEIARNDTIEFIFWLIDADFQKYTDSINEDLDGYTPIQYSCKNNSIEIMKLFLNCPNIDINKKVRTTTLNAAVESSNLEILNLILEKGVDDVNMRDEYGYSALHRAVMKNDKKMVCMLLTQKGIDNNLRTKKEKMSSLHIACQNGFIEIVKLLLSSFGINVNSYSVDGMTPLHSAIKNNFVEICSLLLKDLFININSVNDKGDSPIHTAVWNQNEEIVKMLIENDVEINVLNKDLFAPIHIAAIENNIEIFRALLNSKNIEINSKGDGV